MVTLSHILQVNPPVCNLPGSGTFFFDINNVFLCSHMLVFFGFCLWYTWIRKTFAVIIYIFCYFVFSLFHLNLESTFNFSVST